MAVPAYATDLNDIFLDGAAAWTLVGGGRQTAVETDDYIQGTSCWSHDPFSTGLEGGVHNSAETVATDDAVFVWIKCDVVATISTHAAGGQRILIGNSATTLDSYYVLGSDDYAYGGWKCIPIDPTITPSTTVGGGSTGATNWFGGQWNVPAAGASKGYPMKVDAMRHGRQLEVTAGEIANPASWDSTSIHDSTTTRQWGICQPTNSGAELQGLIYWGTGAASVYSRDSNRTITIIDTEWTATDFTQILFAHASNDVVWDNVGLLALGTSNRGIIDVTANGTVTWTNSVFQGIDITTLLSGCTFDGSKWLGCNEVDGTSASLLNAKILTPTVVANSHGLLWDVVTDPDGKLDGMEFSKGTNAHHAIDFGTSVTSDIYLRDMEFTGFGTTEDGNDAALRFLATTGSLICNLVGCTVDGSPATASTLFKDDSAGIAVTLVFDPVTYLINVKDGDGVNVSNARAYLVASDNIGDLPYLDPITSITRAANVATVTHTDHGLNTDEYINIYGITDKTEDNSGSHKINVTNSNVYSYITTDSGSTSYTGAITGTGVLLFDLTDVNGNISSSRTLGSNQNVTGNIRKSSSSPRYKSYSLAGNVIDSTGGMTLNIRMVLDE